MKKELILWFIIVATAGYVFGKPTNHVDRANIMPPEAKPVIVRDVGNGQRELIARARYQGQLQCTIDGTNWLTIDTITNRVKRITYSGDATAFRLIENPEVRISPRGGREGTSDNRRTFRQDRPFFGKPVSTNQVDVFQQP